MATDERDTHEAPGRFLVRSWSGADRAAALSIRDGVYPEYRTEPAALHLATQLDAPSISPFRYVALAGETRHVIGYGAVWVWKAAWRKYRLDLIVHPAWWKQGIGALLLSRLLDDLHTQQATTVQARVREDQPDARTFLERHGFVPVQRMDALRLEIADVGLATLASYVQCATDQGIAITTLSRGRNDDAQYLAKLHVLQNAVLPDWPDPDPSPFSPIAVEDVARRLEAEVRHPEGFFIAIKGDQFVGYSDLSGFGTAVCPEFRGRGIATALKASAIAHAQRNGLPNVCTCTAHPAMRAINEKLGFRLVHSETRLLKALDG
jgi:GNAT superfamily N-acetyltransferase